MSDGKYLMACTTSPQLWFTYGPQTKTDTTLHELFASGATGVRLTFSYGTPALQIERASQVRRIADNVVKDVLIVADLQGEKCRFAPVVGHDEVPVREGDEVTLVRTTESSLSPLRLPLQIPNYIDTLHPGDTIIEGDGALSLIVTEVNSLGAVCRCGTDGVIHPGRGLVVQARGFSPRSITEKDKADLTIIGESRAFDAVAVSFVSRPEDVHTARVLLEEQGAHLPIVAKIETQLGLDNLTEIALESDMLMAARGDLALAKPWVELPEAVSQISNTAKQLKKPWILATQIVEGLERFAFPTRAEICDLEHWISSGAFGVMLSYETAFGRRPVDAIRCVRAIIDRYYKKEK
jgi:pyruvate kinase